MPQSSPTPVLDHQCLLGEGPVWDARQGRILWVDILQGHIHEHYPGSGQHSTFYAGEMVGAVALRKGGGIIAALRSGFAFIDMENGNILRIANPEAGMDGNRFNDGKPDPDGRFWAGTMSLHDEPGAGALYTLHPEGLLQKKISGVSISNGLAWSHDSRIFYYIDTPTLKVVAYDYDPISSAITHPRTVISIPPEMGDPDGMTIDTEGMLWIAHWDGWQVSRWDPATGTMLSTIRLPVSRVTSCTFGGRSLSDLYITSARTGLSDEQLSEQPLAGSLFVLRNCGHTGHPAAAYGG